MSAAPRSKTRGLQRWRFPGAFLVFRFRLRAMFSPLAVLKANISQRSRMACGCGCVTAGMTSVCGAYIASGRTDALLVKWLTFAEERSLSIPLFSDCNGRGARLFLRDQLRRLDIPSVALARVDKAGEADASAALKCGGKDPRPWMRNAWVAL